MKYYKEIIMFVSDVTYVWMTLYAMIVAATMVGVFYFLQKGKSWLEKSQIGKKRWKMMINMSRMVCPSAAAHTFMCPDEGFRLMGPDRPTIGQEPAFWPFIFR